MLSKLKTYVIAVLGVISAVFFGLFYREKAKHEKAVRKGVEKAREVEKNATEALLEGLENEGKITIDDDDTFLG